MLSYTCNADLFLLNAVAKIREQHYNLINYLYFSRSMRSYNIDDHINYRHKAVINSDFGQMQNTFRGEVGRVLSAFNACFTMIRSVVMLMVYLVLVF